MEYKGICPNCKGNGYEQVTNNKGKTNIHQCWMCESEGEVKGSQAKVDDSIRNIHLRKRLH